MMATIVMTMIRTLCLCQHGFCGGQTFGIHGCRGRGTPVGLSQMWKGSGNYYSGSMMMVILAMIRMVMIMIMKRGTLSIAIGSMGRTGGLSSGIPVDIIGRIPFIVLHVDHHHGWGFKNDDARDWQTSLNRYRARSLGRRIWQTQDLDPGTNCHY